LLARAWGEGTSGANGSCTLVRPWQRWRREGKGGDGSRQGHFKGEGEASRLRQQLRELAHADGRASTHERWCEGGQTAHGGDAASKLLPVLLFID